VLFGAPKDGVTGPVGLERGRVGRSTPQKCNMTPLEFRMQPFRLPDERVDRRKLAFVDRDHVRHPPLKPFFTFVTPSLMPL
jgi:hypothetical protein